MDSNHAIVARFGRMGARVKIEAERSGIAPIRINVLKDNKGEYFELRVGEHVEATVVDVRPEDRHLLLMTRRPGSRGREEKQKFLCGHDERAWFVAAVPEIAGVSGVASAMEALKPRPVREEQARKGVRHKDRRKRHTEAYLRQGEWFFLPRPRLSPPASLVLRNEPIRRGSGKPHLCQELYRTGGIGVHVNHLYPDGLTDAEFAALPTAVRERHTWRRMTRDARAFVRGTVRHPDHKTIRLPFWHRVVMNTESESRAMAGVAFLD